MKNKLRKIAGFTLIELLVVIAALPVTGLLIGLLLPAASVLPTVRRPTSACVTSPR